MTRSGWTTGRAEAEETSLAYESLGPVGAPAVVLISSLGRQGVQWPTEACERLAEGDETGRRQVVRFDHRDTGHSTWRSPRPWVGYDRDQLARDVIAVLDGLEIERAHVVGRSMGGVVAQTVALQHPERVATLTSIFAPAGQGPEFRPEVLRRRIAQSRESPPSAEEWIDEQLTIQVRQAGHRYPVVAATERACLTAEVQRAFNPEGSLSHRMASLDCRSHRDELDRITVPALFIHGTADPIVALNEALFLTNAVTGSTLYVLEGLGHHLPQPAWEELTPVLLAHTRPR